MKKLSALCVLLLCLNAASQVSVATDLSLLRNFSRQQSFWAIGQTLQAQWHVGKKETFFAWVNYFSEAVNRTRYSTAAKSLMTTNPPYLGYFVNSSWRYRHFSIGWKHYFTGGYNPDEEMSVYGLAGFGLMFNRITNRYNITVDTNKYHVVQPIAGTKTFKNLTFDIGAGIEFPLGGGLFWYTDARTFIPASMSSSPYLHDNSRSVPVTINTGLRILFSDSY